MNYKLSFVEYKPMDKDVRKSLLLRELREPFIFFFLAKKRNGFDCLSVHTKFEEGRRILKNLNQENRIKRVHKAYGTGRIKIILK